MSLALVDRPQPLPGRVPSALSPVRGYVPTLDGWRAVAILGVLVCHASDPLFGDGCPLANHWLDRVTRLGGLGVDLFFGISGFLICSRLVEEERIRGRIRLTGFYIRRTCRIVPPYLAYLAVIGLAGAFGCLAVNRREWLSCLLFWRNYLWPSVCRGFYTGHFWSLALEEHFYLLWPCFLVFLGRARSKWLAVLLALAVAVWRLVEFRHQWLRRLLPGLDFYSRTDVRLDSLLWGCWLALMVADSRERLTRRLTTPVWLLLAVALVGCVVGQPPLVLLWQAFLIPLVIAGTVLRPAGLVGRLLESAALRWIGRLSYSLYLWQQLFLIDRHESRPLGPWQQMPLNLIALLACALLSYFLVERPAVRFGHCWAAPATPGRMESSRGSASRRL